MSPVCTWSLRTTICVPNTFVLARKSEPSIGVSSPTRITAALYSLLNESLLVNTFFSIFLILLISNFDANLILFFHSAKYFLLINVNTERIIPHYLGEDTNCPKYATSSKQSLKIQAITFLISNLSSVLTELSISIQ